MELTVFLLLVSGGHFTKHTIFLHKSPHLAHQNMTWLPAVSDICHRYLFWNLFLTPSGLYLSLSCSMVQSVSTCIPSSRNLGRFSPVGDFPLYSLHRIVVTTRSSFLQLLDCVSRGMGIKAMSKTFLSQPDVCTLPQVPAATCLGMHHSP